MDWILEIGVFPKTKTSVLADDIDHKNKYIVSKDHCVVPSWMTGLTGTGAVRKEHRNSIWRVDMELQEKIDLFWGC